MEDPRFELGEFEREIQDRKDEIGNLQDSIARSKLDIAFDLTALIYNVRKEDMQATGRVNRRLAEARQVAMYLANVALGVEYAEIGLYANRNRGTIRHSIERVEDRRDHPAFDALIESMEKLIQWVTSEPVAKAISEGVRVSFDAGPQFAGL